MKIWSAMNPDLGFLFFFSISLWSSLNEKKLVSRIDPGMVECDRENEVIVEWIYGKAILWIQAYKEGGGSNDCKNLN